MKNVKEEGHLEQGEQAKNKIEVSDGSWIQFTVNGKPQPQVFKNIYEGAYHAGVSMYMHGRCKVNFGPNFVHKPPNEKVLAYSTLFDSTNPSLVHFPNKLN